jgi:hypothetical protein
MISAIQVQLRPNYVEIRGFCTATAFASRNCCQRASMRPLSILLASPRGFCAGVERAIQTVEETLNRFGAPVFVRHQIVHNPSVVAGLAAKGAVFVEELDEIPDDAPIVFSAHGVAKSVRSEAERRRLPHIDATCPLVTKTPRSRTPCRSRPEDHSYRPRRSSRSRRHNGSSPVWFRYPGAVGGRGGNHPD